MASRIRIGTLAESAASEEHGSPTLCVGCHYAGAEPVGPIVPCRLTYIDGSVAKQPVHYCQACREIINAAPDHIMRADILVA